MMPKLLDDIVICVAVGFGLLIALFLSWQLVVHGAEFPPTLISAFLGIAIAALTYRFLGGSANTEFSMGVLKLGGSAALLLGTTWFVGDRLREEIRLYSEMERYRTQIETLDAERGKAVAEVRNLSKQLSNAPTAKSVYSLSEIKLMKPNEAFIQSIKRMVEGQQYPFVQTLRELAVKVSVIRTTNDRATFNVCSDTLIKLNEGVDVPNPDIMFMRTPEGHDAVSVVAVRSGKIDENKCTNAQREIDGQIAQREFDVQISCTLALKLFPDVIADCAQGQLVRGMSVTIGSLAD